MIQYRLLDNFSLGIEVQFRSCGQFTGIGKKGCRIIFVFPFSIVLRTLMTLQISFIQSICIKFSLWAKQDAKPWEFEKMKAQPVLKDKVPSGPSATSSTCKVSDNHLYEWSLMTEYSFPCGQAQRFGGHGTFRSLQVAE